MVKLWPDEKKQNAKQNLWVNLCHKAKLGIQWGWQMLRSHIESLEQPEK